MLQLRPNSTETVPYIRTSFVKSLKHVLDLLNQHHQRATYGAVAGLLGKAPRSLMQGLPRDWRHSWIVNKESGLPSEYP